MLAGAMATGEAEMQIGVVFPSTDIGDDVALLRDFAQTAEGLGYSHLLLPDHVLGAVREDRHPPLTGVYAEDTPFHEPLVLFAYLAAITERIGFSTGILIAPQRQTALLAKQTAELAILSGNRFRLALGLGWNHVEYEALGETFWNRGRRIEEQVEVLRRLWSEPVVNFSGNWHRIDRAGILPRPSRPIPIWFGGKSEAAYRRAARLAEGFVFTGVNFEQAKQVTDLIRREVEAAGRDPAAFGIEGGVSVHGDPANWGRRIDNWRKLDASHLVLRTMSRDGDKLTTPGDHVKMLETFWRTVHG
jgi:probable F420-dependent oxidoreductase